MTGATYQREFVRSHPDYRGDSVVPPRVAHDLLTHLHRVAAGTEEAPNLVGRDAPRPVVFKADSLGALREEVRLPAGGLGASSSVTLHLTPEEAHAHPPPPAPMPEPGAAPHGQPLLPTPAGSGGAGGGAGGTDPAAGGGAPAGPSPVAPPLAVPSLLAFPHYRDTADGGGAGATSARMRGASFAEEGAVVAYPCDALASLIEHYRRKWGLEPGPRTRHGSSFAASGSSAPTSPLFSAANAGGGVLW
jgi:hypothetical protein